ncbi:MAG: 4-hydroxy-tetrahydrodipicolinate reductase [Bacteroidales bacterium]
MKIALVGYGKMGQEIEVIARERGHQISLIVDFSNRADLNAEKLADIDLAIEFTSPETAYENLTTCLSTGTPVVCGSTGWLSKMEDVKRCCSANNSAFFYASNYSLGVNLFFRLNQHLARMMSKVADTYHVALEEVHHTAKKDAPSGTAITLAEGILEEMPNYSNWALQPNVVEGEIPIGAIRRDPVPGTHSVIYDSDIDTITITHEAKNRKGFALGAVLAAEFLIGKQGCFGMDDLLKWM